MRAAAAAGLAAVIALVAPGEATAAQFSNTCTAPNAQLIDGFAGPAYVALRIQQDPSDASTTWVCYRAWGGGGVDLGGRVDVDQGSTQPNLPTTDSASDACSTAPGNAVPGPHPLVNGAIGHPAQPTTLPYLLDAYSGQGQAWVCFRFDSFAQRVIVRPPTVGIPSIQVNHDDATVPDPVETAARPGYPSATCHGDSARRRLLDVGAGPTHLWLYSSSPSASQTRLCVRAEGPVSAGGMLVVDGSLSPGFDPSQVISNDLTPCTWLVAEGVQPVQYSITRSPGTTVPASLCVSSGSTRLRVSIREPSVSPVLPTVTWLPDPGTPGV